MQLLSKNTYTHGYFLDMLRYSPEFLGMFKLDSSHILYSFNRAFLQYLWNITSFIVLFRPTMGLNLHTPITCLLTLCLTTSVSHQCTSLTKVYIRSRKITQYGLPILCPTPFRLKLCSVYRIPNATMSTIFLSVVEIMSIISFLSKLSMAKSLILQP